MSSEAPATGSAVDPGSATDPGSTVDPVLLPFAASLVRQDWARRVASPAYDGLGVAERRRLLLTHPDSYMHATRSPEDVGDDLSAAELAVLNQMALIRLLRQDAFQIRPGPAVYVYRLDGYGAGQRGIVGLVPLEAYRSGRIRPHERTHAGRQELLSEFLALTSAQSSPVGLAFRGSASISALLDDVEAGAPPILDFSDVNDVHQRVWEVTDPAFVAVLNDYLAGQNLYVTDGHHRLGAGLVVSDRVRRQRAASNAAGGFLPSDIVLATLGHSPPGLAATSPAGAGQELGGAPSDGAGGEAAGSDAILAVLFPHEELRLLVFHRRVTPAAGIIEAEIAAALARLGTLEACDSAAGAAPSGPGRFGVFLGRRWYRFVPTGGVAGIDTAWLQEQIFAPVLGVVDPERTGNIEYVSGVLGAEQLARRCTEAGGVGFVLHPVSIETLMAVADARQVMPPKSTFFHPKPRSGVFLRFQ